MKYTMLFGGEGFMKESDMFSEYIISKNKAYYEIRFEESDCEKVYKVISAVFEKYGVEPPGEHDANGEDGFIYLLRKDEIVRTDRKTEPVKEKMKLVFMSKYSNAKTRSYKRSKKYFDSLLSATDKTKIIKDCSLSNFKRYKFVCKEENTAFCFRLKKSRNENAPLVIFFHGAGCIGKDNFKQYFEAFNDSVRKPLEKYDCSILLPQLPYRFGNYGYDSQHACAVKQLSKLIADEVKADKNRIYVVGTSMGGYNTWQSAYNFPDYYACAVPVMGWLYDYSEEDSIEFEKMKNLPIWIAHSSDDNNVSVKSDDESYKKLSEISDKVKYTRWDKYGHSMAQKFYKNENWAEWMFSQKRS